MSNKYTDAVFKANLPAVAKSILTALAWRMNDKDECWPSHQTLANDAGCSRATAKRWVKRFIELGILEITGQVPAKNGYVHKYGINLTRLTVNPIQSELPTRFTVNVNPVQGELQKPSLKTSSKSSDAAPSVRLGESQTPNTVSAKTAETHTRDILASPKKKCEHGDSPRYCDQCKKDGVSAEGERIMPPTPAAPPKSFPFNIHPWDDVTQEQLDTALTYWEHSPHDWWRSNPAAPKNIASFKRAFPKLWEQAEGFVIPPVKMHKTFRKDCPKCHGEGGQFKETGALVGRGPKRYRQWHECDCWFMEPEEDYLTRVRKELNE